MLSLTSRRKTIQQANESFNRARDFVVDQLLNFAHDEIKPRNLRDGDDQSNGGN